MDALWRIELFGGLCVKSSDRVLTRFRTHKTGALLAYLAYYRQQPHSREVLIELHWPEDASESGRHSLRMALSSLRRQLEPPGVPSGAVIIANRFSVQLNPAAVTTDVAGFGAALQSAAQAPSDTERVRYLAEAVELYRGELLLGYYEEWMLPEQRRLEELFFEALGRLITHLEGSGDLHRALDYARRGVSADPLREEAHRDLMRLYAAVGQHDAALQQFHELERLLKEKLGAAPSVATRALARQISESVPKVGTTLAVSSKQLSAGRKQKAKGKRQKAEGGDTTKPRTQNLKPAPLPLTARQLTGNLPLQFTRFFGREEEIAQLREMLRSPETRLVTLTGPGGSGKTRLAIEAAGRLREAFEGGVWFVSLVDISDARLMMETVRDALRLPRSPDVELLEQVVESLSRRPSLLVLDNMEHLLENGKWKMENGERQGQTSSSILHSPFSILQTLLARVPTLKVLVTSRQRLDLAGEREFAVHPLPTPNGPDTPERLTGCASVQLFVDRAQAVRPDFQVTKRNAAAVAELCDRLEGIPLALELAAARAQVLTPAQMVAQLRRRFDFLVSRQRNVPARHRSLRAAIDWSFHLLAPELRRFCARLSVFRGGWTVEVAEAVAGSEFWVLGSGDDPQNQEPKTQNHAFDVLDYLAQLRDCSLIRAEEGEAEMWFRMLETLREYAEEQLTPEERTALQRRHAGYFLALAERADTALTGPEQGAWLNRLEAEHDNFRAALERALEGEAELGLRLAGALWRFWDMHGYLSEGRRWLEGALTRGGGASASVRAKALTGAGVLTIKQGDFASARALFEESLAIRRELGDKRGVAHSLNNLATVAAQQGDYASARPLFEESLTIQRGLGDKGGVANVLNNLGNVAEGQGDYASARSLYEESLAVFRELGDRWWIAGLLQNLGNISFEQGDYAAARPPYEESLAIFRELGYKHGIAGVLDNLAGIAYSQSDYAAARSLSEEGLLIKREIGDKAGIASSLSNVGLVAYRQGDYAAARAFYEESLTIKREIGDKAGIAVALGHLGMIARQQGDYTSARALHQEALAIRREIGDKKRIAGSLEGLAILARMEGQTEQAARLFGAAASLREALGAPLPPSEQPEHDQNLAALRETLGEAAFTAAYEAGRALNWEQAAAYAFGETA